jgi:tetratricopeptide (TPR) repeat protein
MPSLRPPGLTAALRRGFVVLSLVAWGASLPAAENNERWLKVTAPEFTVITPLKEKDAVAWAGQFSQFIAALKGFINVDPRRLPRLTMVVFAREKDFAAFRPLQENGTVIEVAGFFSRRESWAVAGLAGARMSEETRTTIFHEGTHWFLSGFELPNPVWLEEGLAEVFSTFVIDGKKASWGRPIQPHVDALQLLRPMPLQQLLFLAQDNLHGDSDDASLRTGLAYAQSWAFVHYLIFGQRKVPKGALIDYVKKLRTIHPDEAFSQAFGGTYAEVDRQLNDYMRGGRYFVAHQPILELPAPKAEPASVAEVEDALARLRMAGRRHEEAKASVGRVLAAAPEDPRSYELQGELAGEMGDAEGARSAFRQAAEKGSQDFRTYYEIAYADHLAASGDEGARPDLPPEKARTIANNYKRAINLNLRHRASYQNLAGVIGLLPAGNAEDAKFLGLG